MAPRDPSTTVKDERASVNTANIRVLNPDNSMLLTPPATISRLPRISLLRITCLFPMIAIRLAQD